MAWAYWRHEETNSDGLFADSDTTTAINTAKGWVRHALPEGIDPDDPYAPAALAEVLAAQPDTEPILDPEVAGSLRGQELDDALTVAGLSTSGKVAEKQRRLADHEAELVAPTDPEQPAELATNNNENEE